MMNMMECCEQCGQEMQERQAGVPAQESLLDILKRRYALGEINTEMLVSDANRVQGG